MSDTAAVLVVDCPLPVLRGWQAAHILPGSLIKSATELGYIIDYLDEDTRLSAVGTTEYMVTPRPDLAEHTRGIPLFGSMYREITGTQSWYIPLMYGGMMCMSFNVGEVGVRINITCADWSKPDWDCVVLDYAMLLCFSEQGVSEVTLGYDTGAAMAEMRQPFGAGMWVIRRSRLVPEAGDVGNDDIPVSKRWCIPRQIRRDAVLRFRKALSISSADVDFYTTARLSRLNVKDVLVLLEEVPGLLSIGAGTGCYIPTPERTLRGAKLPRMPWKHIRYTTVLGAPGAAVTSRTQHARRKYTRSRGET